MAILSVGAGQKYATIAAAVAAAKDGDVVQLKPGTYVNDFPGLVKNITIEAVGGMAKLVATVSPPNRKAWFVTTGNVTLANLDVSGVKVADLNGAPVRYQGGNLTIINSYFHNNQEGLLAANDPSGSITIKNSEIAYNGSNGYSHNVYIGDVGTTIVDNSYIHDVLGHGSEFRSRGANTTITNSRIVDNSYADNYTLDFPNGGNVSVSNTVLQKAAGATNPIMVHFSPDSVGAWHTGSKLAITGSTLINNNGASAWGVFIGNGAPATVTGNISYGLQTSHFVYGGTASATTFVSTAPVYSKAAPWTSAGITLNTTPAPTVSGQTTIGGASMVTGAAASGVAATDTAAASVSTIVGGSGHILVNGAGEDTIFAGSGSVTTNGPAAAGDGILNAGTGAVSPGGGSGGLTFFGGSGSSGITEAAGSNVFGAGSSSTPAVSGGGNTLSQFATGEGLGGVATGGSESVHDSFNFDRFSGGAALSQPVVSGSTPLNLVDGTQITLSGLILGTGAG